MGAVSRFASSRFTRGPFNPGDTAGGLRVELDAAPGGYRLRIRDMATTAIGAPTLTEATQGGTSFIADITPTVNPDLSSNVTPGQVSGSNVVVASPTGTLDAGARYFIAYEITADGGTTQLSTGAASAFGFVALPRTIGVHVVALEAVSGTATGAFLVVNGNLTFARASIFKGEWDIPTDGLAAPAGTVIELAATAGAESQRARFALPEAGEIFVSTASDGLVATGAMSSPFATVEQACAVAGPGDTIYLRPGIYRPFEILAEGAAGNPLTVTTLPGEERLAVVQGNLRDHATFGGPGVGEQDNAFRDGVRCIGRSHVVIENLSIGYVWRDGIRVLGAGVGTVTTGVTVRNVFTEQTGLAGILMAGESPDNPVPVGDAYRLTNVLIEDCEITATNVVTDYNQDSGNSLGGGGVGECITIANSVDGFTVQNNLIRDSLQYGADAKVHVRNGTITGNTIRDVLRYGIYIDAGRRDVRAVVISNNVISRCRQGIVLARENRSTDVGDALVLDGIDILNNVVFETSRPGFVLDKHPDDDEPLGAISNIRARFNTFYNTATDTAQTYQDINIDAIAEFGNRPSDGQPIVSNIEFIGNLAWNSDGDMRMRIPDPSDTRFTVVDNLNVQDGAFTGTDPLFTDPAGGDFTPQAGSPVLDIVAGYSAAPFDVDAVGTTRADPADAGAFERT